MSEIRIELYEKSIPEFVPGREGLRRLARALCAPMPANFEWDYSIFLDVEDCKTSGCAIGLAKVIWPKAIMGTSITYIARIFDTKPSIIEELFYALNIYEVESSRDVTPQMVADQIDRYLDRLDSAKEDEGN